MSMNHLKWMTHDETMLDIHKALRDDFQQRDVTLIGQGRQVQAHRFVLSCCSDMLRALLVDAAPDQDVTIMVPDVRGVLLDSVITFIYTGEACLNANNLSEFLETINYLGIKSAISFECLTSTKILTHELVQVHNIANVLEEEVEVQRLENNMHLQKADERDLEFLEDYAEVQPKITYAIEHAGGGGGGGEEFILTENAGSFTLVQHTEVCDNNKSHVEQLHERQSHGQQVLEDYSMSECVVEVSTGENVEMQPAVAVATNVPAKIRSARRDGRQRVLSSAQASASSSATATVVEDIKITGAAQEHKSSQIVNEYAKSVEESDRDSHYQLAVQAVVHEGMSLKKASDKYQISKTVLWRRVRKHPMYMKTARINPLLEAATKRLQRGESLKTISQALEIPMSTLHRHKVRLAQEGRLPDTVKLHQRTASTREQMRVKLEVAVQSCLQEGMSQNCAANLYEIPKSTLWRHLQKRMSESHMLCMDEEAIDDEEEVAEEPDKKIIKEETILS